MHTRPDPPGKSVLPRRGVFSADPEGWDRSDGAAPAVVWVPGCQREGGAEPTLTPRSSQLMQLAQAPAQEEELSAPLNLSLTPPRMSPRVAGRSNLPWAQLGPTGVTHWHPLGILFWLLIPALGSLPAGAARSRGGQEGPRSAASPAREPVQPVLAPAPALRPLFPVLRAGPGRGSRSPLQGGGSPAQTRDEQLPSSCSRASRPIIKTKEQINTPEALLAPSRGREQRFSSPAPPLDAKAPEAWAVRGTWLSPRTPGALRIIPTRTGGHL